MSADRTWLPRIGAVLSRWRARGGSRRALTPSALRAALEERGSPINPGLEGEPDFSAEPGFRALIPDRILAFQRAFDGFEAPDGLNMITMWSLEQILRETRNWLDPSSGRVVIGDWIIDSDALVCTLTDPAAPVVLLREERRLGDSYEDFWRRFLAGEFDFVRERSS